MTRFLLLSSLIAATMNAADISELVRYLDVNGTERFKALVTTEDDANARRSDNNKTILMYAAWTGNAKALEHLLAHGADINAKDSEGVTPLMLAIFKDHTDIALRLIREGADVNATARDGMTPLLLSKIRTNSTVEKALQDAGANEQPPQ